MAKLNVKKNEVIVTGDDFVAKLIRGMKGNINIKTPFGKRKVKIVKKFKAEKKN